MNPQEMRRRLGGKAHGDRWQGPGPGHSERDNSLEVWFKPDAPEGFLTYSFAGDDVRTCRDHVRQALGLEAFTPHRRSRLRKRHGHPVLRTQRDDDQVRRIAAAGTIWGETVDPRGTIVETYLQSRGLALDTGLADVIRFHAATNAMVALLRDIHTDQPCGVHRTFLTGEGQKIGRKMLGRASGASIKLDGEDAITLGLHVGEGIETTLSGRRAGLQPAWALGSADAIAKFPRLIGIEALTILAERDPDGERNVASYRAINHCAITYLAAGVEVLVVDPPHGDLNSHLDRRGA
jgi:hypothetical protein